MEHDLSTAQTMELEITAQNAPMARTEKWKKNEKREKKTNIYAMHVNNYCLFMFFMYHHVVRCASCAFASFLYIIFMTLLLLLPRNLSEPKCYHKHCHKLSACPFLKSDEKWEKIPHRSFSVLLTAGFTYVCCTQADYDAADCTKNISSASKFIKRYVPLC